MDESKEALKNQILETVNDSKLERLSLIRLSRMSAYERFSPKLRETIKSWLMNGWSDLPSSSPSPSVVLPTLPDGELEFDKTIVMKNFEPKDCKEDLQNASLTFSKEVLNHQKIQLRLRRLVSQEASWSQIKSLCEQWLDMDSNAQTAAKIIELASLHASQEEWLQVIKILLGNYPNAYALIHEDLRESMILLLWQLDEREIVVDAVFNRKGDQEIVDRLSVEKISVLLHLISQNQKEESLLYFKTNEVLCLAAIRKYSKYFHFTEDTLRMSLARFAAEKNLPHELRRLGGATSDAFEDLGSEDEFVYQQSRIEGDGSLKVEAILQKITLQKNWQDRLVLLKKLASHVHSVDRKKVNRNYVAVLDRITQDPMAFVPDIPETLADYTKFLWEYRALSVLIPNWFYLLDQFAPVWSEDLLELSIWGFAEECNPLLESNQESHWFALASLHLSAVHLKMSQKNSLWEKRLWEARDLYLVTMTSKSLPIKYLWDDLIESLQESILQAFDLDSKVREGLIFLLEVFKESSSKTQLDLEKNELFLDNIQHMRTWDGLKNFYRSNRSHKNLEILLQNYFRLFSPTNFDLGLMWESSAIHFNYDRCWRVASILSSRESLNKSVEASWQVSGERRSAYGFNSIRDQDVIRLWSNFSKKEVRLFHALFKLSPSLAEIFKIVGVAESSQLKETSLFLSPLNFFSRSDSEDPLDACPVIRGSKSYESMRGIGQLSSSALPSWIEVYPSNPWTELLFKIAQRNGFFIWEWKLSQLRSILSEVITGISKRANSASYSTRVAQWLRSLDAEQRSCWSELPVLCKIYEDEDSFKNLFLFLAKVTTLIYPAHFQALESLRVMRMPLDIIRDFERWLLSQEYEIFRNQLGQKTNIPIPKSYEKAEKILK